jgi:hypothetical protein
MCVILKHAKATTELMHYFTGKADIVFLLDSSTQLGPKNFKQELLLFDTVAQSFPVKKDGVNFASVVYSDRIKVPFQLNTHADKPTLSIAIQAIPFVGGGSRVGDAIASVKSGILDKSGRPGVAKVVAVLMNEKSEDDMVEPATALKAEGVKLIMVGIGKGVDASLLGSLASSPDSVLLVDKLDELPAQAAPLVVKINNGK